MKKVRISIVDRYLIVEFLKPFLFSIFALTIIMIGSQLFELADLIIIKKVPIITVIKLLLYKIPDIMVQSFAISILFATLLSMTQLVKNNEFTALRMGGISLHRLVIPFLLVALLVSGLTFLTNEKLVPWSNHQAENIIRMTILKKGLPDLQEGIFFKGIEERYFYIGKIEDSTGKLEDVLVYEMNEDKKFPRLIKAKEGLFKNKVWYLTEGKINKFDSEGNLVYQSDFDKLEINVNDELDNFYGEQRTTSEMSRAKLLDDIKLFKKSGLDVNSLLIDYHLKLSKTFACFIFVLVGLPLSIKSKEGRSFGIIASVIVVFIYYVATSFCRSLGRNDLLPPLLAAWIPNLVFILIGVYLLFKEEYFKLR